MSRIAAIVSVFIGFLMCIGIWILVPLNNFALNNSFVSDGYLSEVVLLGVLLLVLLLNPLLKLLRLSVRISRVQLTVIVSMVLFASILPSNGLMRFFPHTVGYVTEQINQSIVLAPAVKDSELPPSLFSDPIGFDLETPVASQLVDELDEDAKVPWKAWIKPALAWGSVFVSSWIMMIGLGLMVFPQWRDSERLPFPLLRVYNALIDVPEQGATLPPIFKSAPFWVGCGCVFLIHSFNGLNVFTDGSWPGFPVRWNVGALFTEGAWRYAPGFLKQGRIYFAFIGLAYFMPTRYSFSIWFTVVVSGFTIMFTTAYVPFFKPFYFYDMGCGALIAIAAWCAWLGRSHYMGVFAAAFRRGNAEQDKANALAGRLFLTGCALLLAWFVWAGTSVGWALLFVTLGVMVMFLVARIVAETGLTYVWIIPLAAGRIMGYLPQSIQSLATMFLRSAHNVIFNRVSAVSVAVMMTLALGLKRKHSVKSDRQMAGGAISVLLLGLLICGAVHLLMGYHLASSFDGVNSPIVGRGARLLGLDGVMNVAAARIVEVKSDAVAMAVAGAAIGGILLFLCSRFPRWPLHPIGMIFVYSSIGLRLVNSLLIGWAIKTLIVRYGGARVYRAAMPVFLGLIVGEVFANAFWTLVSVAQILLGADPAEVSHMIIFQYT